MKTVKAISWVFEQYMGKKELLPVNKEKKTKEKVY